MAKRILAALLCLVVLSSCSPISMDPEDLLEPPRLNQRQAKIEAALDTSLGLGEITYRYPQSGSFRSPFVFYDLDRDGREEAIVFYTYNTNPEHVRFKALRETEAGDWVNVCDLAGAGNQVDFIEFASVLDTGRDCLLVGWQTARGGLILSVYSFVRDTFERELEMSYLTLATRDYFSDGLTEIALVYEDFSGNHQLALLGRRADGKLASMGEAALSSETTSVLQMQNSLLWPGSYGIVIDALLMDNNTATEIFEITRTGLVPVVSEEEYELYAQTFRAEDSLSVLLPNTETVAIPQTSTLPGYVADSELSPPPLITYIKPIRSGGFEEAAHAVINDNAGYMFFFPERWLNQVTVLRRPESNEWQFYKIEPTTNLPTTELLRIRVHSVRDYRDRFIDNYITLAEKGLFQYYAYLPRLATEPLALNEADLRRLFILL